MEKVKNSPCPSRENLPSFSCETKARRVGLCEVLEKTELQIELVCFPERDKPFAKELALIIADVALLPQTVNIRIDGVQRPATYVQEIYSRLTHEHIALVIEKFKKVDFEIKFKKTYLRTLLFNSVFEFESTWENELHAFFSPLEG